MSARGARRLCESAGKGIAGPGDRSESDQCGGRRQLDCRRPQGFNVLLARYAKMVEQLAREEKLPLIDVYQAFEDYGKGEGQAVDQLLLDGMHPNAAGHRIIADLLLEQLSRGKESLKP
jgi:hypothetical protein